MSERGQKPNFWMQVVGVSIGIVIAQTAAKWLGWMP